MKVLFNVVGAVVAIIGVIVIIMLVVGSQLPPGHIASRSIRLDRPLIEVYTVVRDFGGSPEWRTNVKSVEMLGTSENGHVQFREHGSNDVITYELITDLPNEQIVTRIADRDLGYSGTWTYVFSQDDGDTIITITENGEVSNLIFRFMSHYLFGHTSMIDKYLTGLANHFGESASPQ